MDEKEKKNPVKLTTWGSNKITIPTRTRMSAQDRLLKSKAESVKQEAEQQSESWTAPNRIALCADCSGSMAGEPIKQLREACKSFVESCNLNDTAVAIRTFGFESYSIKAELSTQLMNDADTLTFEIDKLRANGGTPMREALEWIVSNLPVTRVVLVSDGQPTDLRYSHDLHLEMQKSLVFKEFDMSWLRPFMGEAGCPIDCVHISDSNLGEDLMKFFAEQTGGVYIKFKDVINFAQHFKFLAPKYRALLNAPGAAALLGSDEFRGGKK